MDNFFDDGNVFEGIDALGYARKIFKQASTLFFKSQLYFYGAILLSHHRRPPLLPLDGDGAFDHDDACKDEDVLDFIIFEKTASEILECSSYSPRQYSLRRNTHSFVSISLPHHLSLPLLALDDEDTFEDVDAFKDVNGFDDDNVFDDGDNFKDSGTVFK